MTVRANTMLATSIAQILPSLDSITATTTTTSTTSTVAAVPTAAGFDPGPVDGVFGTRSRTAVTAFQVAQGLASTGAVDAATGVALGIR